jgi:putative tricarboxylic transport membrane protein
MVHNYIPGPRLFTEHPEFISGLYVSLFFMNAVVFIYLTFASKYIVNITRVRGRFIGALIFVLGFLGAYSQNYQISDALIALFFSIVGYVMKRNNIPAVPIILGLVLGPVFLNRMRQALGVSNGEFSIFLDRPIALTLFVMTVLSIVVFCYSKMRNAKENA